jgi:oxalate decarboxylase/phosphoglucose isomerase-like protein (cupin superfamily)
MRWPEPCSFQVDVKSGLMTGTSTRYQKDLRHLRGLYADTAAFEALVDARGNDVVYEHVANTANLERSKQEVDALLQERSTLLEAQP